MNTSSRILERGYRRYTGPRESVGHAMRSTIAQTLRHMMGLHRPARYKVLPFITLAIVFLPGVAFVGAASFLPAEADEFIPTYWQYYGYVSGGLVLFAAIVIPDALCGDRRSRSLSLYFSSALSRMTYLASKFLAVVIALLFGTLAPSLLLLVGYVIQGEGPTGALGFAATLARVIGSGLAIALAYAGIGMAMSTITDRRGFASAAIFFGVGLSGILSGILVFVLHVPKAFFLVSFVRAQSETVRTIFGLPPFGSDGFDREFSIGSAWWPIAVAEALWIAVPIVFCVQRYRKGRVTR